MFIIALFFFTISSIFGMPLSLKIEKFALLKILFLVLSAYVDICSDMPLQYATFAICVIHISSTTVKVEFLK